MMKARLARSQSDKVLGGVCAGLGDYLNIDPVFVRIFFILLTILDGIGFMLYLILWIVMPLENQADQDSKFEMNQVGDRARQMGNEFGQAVRSPNPQAAKYLGIGLILAGVFFFAERLVRQFDLRWFAWVNRDAFWAALLVAAGTVLLVRAIKER
jgi:phage shock protein PspC (stress-responsive transcriptional regulator)